MMTIGNTYIFLSKGEDFLSTGSLIGVEVARSWVQLSKASLQFSLHVELSVFSNWSMTVSLEDLKRIREDSSFSSNEQSESCNRKQTECWVGILVIWSASWELFITLLSMQVGWLRFPSGAGFACGCSCTSLIMMKQTMRSQSWQSHGGVSIHIDIYTSIYSRYFTFIICLVNWENILKPSSSLSTFDLYTCFLDGLWYMSAPTEWVASNIEAKVILACSLQFIRFQRPPVTSPWLEICRWRSPCYLLVIYRLLELSHRGKHIVV